MLHSPEYAGRWCYTTQSQKHQDKVDSELSGVGGQLLKKMVLHVTPQTLSRHKLSIGATAGPRVGHLSRPQREREALGGTARGK